MLRNFFTAVICVCAAAAVAQDPPAASAAAKDKPLPSSAPGPGLLDESLRREKEAAVERALDWLVAQQRPDGSWSNTNFPALTALPMLALVRSGDDARKPAIAKAKAFLLAHVREDGGIYRAVPGRKGGGLSNYNTAICMTTLYALRDPALAPVILRAREFVAGAQHTGDDLYSGGFGYDAGTGRAYADLLNTYYSVEALRLTEGAEDLRRDGRRADINWDAAVRFITRMQNLEGASADEKGGFIYNPTDAKAGATTNAQGAVTFRSYGSITYSGMLALIYANVPKEDARVRAALDWASRRWSLDENPALGQRGVYFFYGVLTRCLAAAGVQAVDTPNGVVEWRAQVARKLVSLQRIEAGTGRGYWVNAVNDWWENDPVLVTSYALQALQML